MMIQTNAGGFLTLTHVVSRLVHQLADLQIRLSTKHTFQLEPSTNRPKRMRKMGTISNRSQWDVKQKPFKAVRARNTP